MPVDISQGGFVKIEAYGSHAPVGMVGMISTLGGSLGSNVQWIGCEQLVIIWGWSPTVILLITAWLLRTKNMAEP